MHTIYRIYVVLEHLDFLHQGELPDGVFTHFEQLEHEYIGYQSLTDVPKSILAFEETDINYQHLKDKPIWEIIDALRNSSNIYAKCQLWGLLLKREGPHYEVNGYTVQSALHDLYHQAGVLRYWRAVRYCSSLLNHTVDSISPFITTVLVNGKQVCHFIYFVESFKY